MQLHGIDFTSAPSRRKAITIATGVLEGDCFLLQFLESHQDYLKFEAWLRKPGPWIGVFDLPFSLPRELIETLKWPTEWIFLVKYFASLTRPQIRQTFKAFCDNRPIGNKFAHRATDQPARSSSSMKWVNPPVAYMLHAGAPRLIDAGLTIFGMHPGDPQRIALEGYPGMLARSITKLPYKNDAVSKQTEARTNARCLILEKLKNGDHPFKILLNAGQHTEALIKDGSGDLLDAVLCAIFAAWAWQRKDANFGLPGFDSLEGWIVGA
jgi:hypothetical protein